MTRRSRLLVFSAALATALLAFLAASASQPGTVLAGDDVDFSVAVAGGGCSTATADMKCDVPSGAPFTVRVSLDGYSTQNGVYSELRVVLATTAGVTSKITHPTQLPATIVWPDCAGNHIKTTASSYDATCSAEEPSGYTGVVVQLDYNCEAGTSGTITLQQPVGGGGTHIVSDKELTAVDTDGDETLTITCFATVGGVQADLSGRLASGGAGTASGAIAGGAAAALVTFAGLGWNLRRRKATL